MYSPTDAFNCCRNCFRILLFCSVDSNHSVDSFAEIVALSYYPVITRDRATMIFQFSSNGVDATRSEGVLGFAQLLLLACCLGGVVLVDVKGG